MFFWLTIIYLIKESMLLEANLITPDPVKNNVFFSVSLGSQAEQGVTHEREDKDRTLNSEEVTQD